MNKLVIALMAVMMLGVAGCASQQAAMKDAVKSATATPVASGSPLDPGDPSPLPDIAPVDEVSYTPLPM
jgi:PBP1b-binding outer membrane lipoprotein LpoB